MKALFISWDGPGQNFMESLYLPIFRRVQTDDLSIRVLQFTWDEELAASSAESAEKAGIGYEHEDVWRTPLKPATAAMLVKGGLDVVSAARRHDIDVLFPRSLIPGAMALIAKKMLPDMKVLFESDGFMADARVESGRWNPDGAVYRLFRDIEAQLARNSDVVTTLTERGKEVFKARVGEPLDMDSVHVIPNGKDTEKFHPGTSEHRRAFRTDLGVSAEVPFVVYVGSLGHQYYPRAMLEYFKMVRERSGDARMAVLTGHQEVLSKHLDEVAIADDALIVKRVPPGEVPNWLAAADLGLAFRRPEFSQWGCSPVKVCEYLLCGTPVLATAGVGDLDKQIGARTVGHLLSSVEREELKTAVDWFFNEVRENRSAYRERCREVGVEEFGMEECVQRYRHALRDCF